MLRPSSSSHVFSFLRSSVPASKLVHRRATRPSSPPRGLTVGVTLALALGLGLALLVTVPVQAEWSKGIEAFRAGHLDVALTELREVTEQQPEFAGGHLMVGQVLLRQERWSDASASFARAYEIEPEAKPGLLLPWSRALIESDEPEKAVTLLDKLDPSGLDDAQKTHFYSLLSRALMDLKPPARSLERLYQLTRSQPDNPVLWQTLGHALAQADRPAEAAEAFERALELSSDSAAAARRYVDAAFLAARRTGDGDARREWYGRAVDAAELLVAREPTADHWLLLGEARLGARQFREAVQAFEKAAHQAPKDPLPDYYLGEAFLGLEDGDRAELVLRDALRKRPGPDLTLRIHTSLGRAHHLEEEYLQAAREYRAAGDEERAALMEEYQKLADQNDRIERDRRLCQERLGKLEELMADSQDLRGTREWRELEDDIERLRASCG